MRFQITLLAAVLLTAPSNLQAAEPDPTSLLRALRGPDADRDAAVREILAAPERAAPPVLYALSGALLQRGAADDAAFWYLAAQLRLGHAVDRCVGETDRFLGPLFIAELTEDFSARIVRHMVADPVRLNAMIARVVDWDRRTPEAYAPEWLLWRIYLRAPHAEDLVPRADWPALAERARTEFAKRWADGVAWLRASRPLESGAWEIGDV
ncbi:MAG TPA: hypothetical protein VD838_11600, partial [Anaeromyxobacteraceae bacterium]|nr:hypothetical protein [Anaeromyxobacteraceae bacterium]